MKSDPRGDMHRRPPRSDRGMGISVGVVLGVGFSLISSTLAGYLIGTWLDRNRGSALFAPVGLILGLLAGLHRLYRLFRHVAEDKGKGR